MTTKKHGGSRPVTRPDDKRLGGRAEGKKYVPFLVKWPPAMLKKLRQLAAKQNRPIAHLIFEAVDNYLGADAPEDTK